MAYTGFDQSVSDDALTQSVIAHDGKVDGESLQAYGAAAGTMGGAAACTALGAAALSPMCGVIGGKIGGWIASQIPMAHGSTTEDLVSDVLGAMKGVSAEAGRGILAVRAYLTMRDSAIVEAANKLKHLPRDKALAWADQRLTAGGVPGAPILSRWAPTPRRWAAYQERIQMGAAHFDQLKGQCATPAGKAIGCEAWALLAYGFAQGPAGQPGDPIDWWAVGADQAAIKYPSKYFLSPAPGGLTSYDQETAPSFPPSALAEDLIGKLGFARVGLLLAAAKAAKDAPPPMLLMKLAPGALSDAAPKVEPPIALDLMFLPRAEADRSWAKAAVAPLGLGAALLLVLVL